MQRPTEVPPADTLQPAPQRKSLTRPPSQSAETRSVPRLPLVDKAIQARPVSQASSRGSAQQASSRGNAQQIMQEVPAVEVPEPPPADTPRPKTSQSLRSNTSSQRRYIEDLEKLLEEERKVTVM